MIENDLKEYDYISFDIFDTLIKRNVSKPSDIFKLVEIKYNSRVENKIDKFEINRKICESECRKESSTEISIDMIYDKMSKIYGKKVASDLHKLEEEIEINFTQRNNNELINSIYNYALNNKKIILTSDMYLSKEIIEKILKRNNIKYNKLYLSSDIGIRKVTSELFSYVLKDLNIKSDKIIHVGDNKHSDCDMSKKVGIKSIKIPTHINNLLHFNKNTKKEITNNFNYNILQSFINNNIENNDYFSKFGYQCFGPILFGFSEWLLKDLEKNKIEKVFFLARDGKIMKEAFDIINTNKKIKSSYFMASRRSLIVPSFYKYNNIDEIIESVRIKRNIYLYDLIKRFGLDDINIDNLLNKYNLDINKKYDFDLFKEQYKDFLNDLYPLIVDNSKNEKKAFDKYLNKMNFKGKLAIVDIGWFGNMQLALDKLSDSEIYGYYLGLRQNKRLNINTFGYLFDVDKNIDLGINEIPLNSVFEFIFSSTDGSVKKYILDDENDVELYESENVDEYEKNALLKVQEGAIKFVNDYVCSSVHDYCNMDERIYSYNIFNLLHYPSLDDSNNIGRIKFKDGDVYSIADTLGLKKYILRPKKFFSDLNNASWKIGFLKRTFKVNFPYKKVYKFLKRIK